MISEKHGDIILTQNAKDLALHKTTDSDYTEIIKKIALKPDTYGKIYSQFNGQIPSDDILRIRLIKDLDFNVDKVAKFITVFRSTINFAGLSGPIKKEERQEEMYEEVAKVKLDRNIPEKYKISISYDVPLIHQNIATISFQRFPDKQDLSILRQWLTLFENSLKEVRDTQITEDQYGEKEE